ncbi:MAG TPA: hypothetical protein VII01_10240 [Solirubrobacteraceae bacterium]
MARAKQPTPADELAAVDARIAALVAEGETLSDQQGKAEGMIRSYPSRRDDALVLAKLGERVDMPDEAEQARLQRFVADAKDEQDAIRRARRQREEEREKVIAAGLPFFDAEAEESARALEALGEALLAALADFQAGGLVKGEAWGRLRTGRRELRRDLPPGVSSHDLGHLKGTIKDAIRCAWPGESEERWREFKAREQAPPGARVSNREAIAQFGGEAA